MSSFVSPSRADHVVNVAAASIPAIAAGWSAASLAPLIDFPAVPAMATASLTLFLLSYGLMRISGRRRSSFDIPGIEAFDDVTRRVRTFSPPPFQDEDELLLDVPLVEDTVCADDADPSFADVRMQFAAAFDDHEEVLLLDDEMVVSDPLSPPSGDHELGQRVDELSELILDDPLLTPGADSRVVQLFAPQPLPTAGQLVASISRHIEHRDAPAPLTNAPDASEALNEALDSLRDTLRRA